MATCNPNSHVLNLSRVGFGVGTGGVLGSKACRQIENPIGTDSLKMGWGESGFRGCLCYSIGLSPD